MESYLADIVIVNFNTRKYLGECLDSIRSNSGPYQDYKVWVSDNGSTDNSYLEIKNRAWVSGILNRINRGYARACNQGIKSGTGRYIFLLNSDVKVTPGWLTPLIAILSSEPRIAVVGPRLVNPDGYLAGTGVVGTNARPVIRGWGEPDDPERYKQAIPVLSVCGACMGIKRSLLPVLGLFDENYFHYFEETDYCYNARFHGYQVFYCPDSEVIHHGRGSCRNFRKLSKYYRESERYFHQKWKSFLNDPAEYGESMFPGGSKPPKIKS